MGAVRRGFSIRGSPIEQRLPGLKEDLLSKYHYFINSLLNHKNEEILLITSQLSFTFSLCLIRQFKW